MSSSLAIEDLGSDSRIFPSEALLSDDPPPILGVALLVSCSPSSGSWSVWVSPLLDKLSKSVVALRLGLLFASRRYLSGSFRSSAFWPAPLLRQKQLFLRILPSAFCSTGVSYSAFSSVRSISDSLVITSSSSSHFEQSVKAG